MTKRQRQRLATLLPDGVPKFVRCYDNGGTTADRYDVVFTGRYRHKTGGEFWVLGMSGAPFHPQGVGMHAGYTPAQLGGGQWHIDRPKSSHLGRRIKFSDLPVDCQRAALGTYLNLWDLEVTGHAVL